MNAKKTLALNSTDQTSTTTVADPAVAIQALIDTGLNLYKGGRIHEALVEFLQVLAIDPHDPLGHYLCGVALQALELEDMALQEWAAASSLQVRDGEQWNNDWEWIRIKSNQLLEQVKGSSQRSIA